METKKVLFAYDGSSCANEALKDLKRAGLPWELDLLVVTVAEVWVLETEADDEKEEEMSVGGVVAPAIAVSEHTRAGLERARIFAGHAADKIRERHPGWRVDTRVYPDEPAWGVLHAAEEWKPDLIVLGSHGRSAFGRFFLGSVSQKMLSEALCSVRIARGRDAVEGSAVRLLVGVDGTPDSEAAVNEIASRSWPAGSSVKVFSALGPVAILSGPLFAYDAMHWTADQERFVAEWKRMERAAHNAAAKLRDAGLAVDTMILDGAPAPLLLKEAEKLGADCIFLGARGHRFKERFLLGSVSSAVAMRANCSIEVVRTAKAAD